MKETPLNEKVRKDLASERTNQNFAHAIFPWQITVIAFFPYLYFTEHKTLSFHIFAMLVYLGLVWLLFRKRPIEIVYPSDIPDLEVEVFLRESLVSKLASIKEKTAEITALSTKTPKRQKDFVGRDEAHFALNAECIELIKDILEIKDTFGSNYTADLLSQKTSLEQENERLAEVITEGKRINGEGSRFLTNPLRWFGVLSD